MTEAIAYVAPRIPVSAGRLLGGAETAIMI